MKKFAKLVLLFGIVLGFSVKSSYADVRTWCGKYQERDGKGYIMLLSEDIGVGSKKCSMDDYNSRLGDEILVRINIDFARAKSGYKKWRKFEGHLLELRGKYQNAKITNVRLIRDLGV